MKTVLPFRKKKPRKKRSAANPAPPVSLAYQDAAYTEKFGELMMLIGSIDLKPKTVDALINVLRFHEGRPTG
jgi:hypothetical protein